MKSELNCSKIHVLLQFAELAGNCIVAFRDRISRKSDFSKNLGYSYYMCLLSWIIDNLIDLSFHYPNKLKN